MYRAKIQENNVAPTNPKKKKEDQQQKERPYPLGQKTKALCHQERSAT